jgi:hypothetical protein
MLCATCNASLGTVLEPAFPGFPQDCIGCKTKKEIQWMLHAIPTEEERGWVALSEWEQGFVTSVREQFERRAQLSEKQLEVLRRVYKKV